MATPLVIPTDCTVQGTLYPQGFVPPASCITDAAVSAAAAVQATKMIHQHALAVELFGPAVTITALTKLLYVAKAAGNLYALQAAIMVQATGADRTVDIDLQKSTGGGAFATVLTATIHTTNATVIRTVLTPGAFTSTAYSAGDIFQLVVTVAGAAGAQAQGLIADLFVRESP